MKWKLKKLKGQGRGAVKEEKVKSGHLARAKNDLNALYHILYIVIKTHF